MSNTTNQDTTTTTEVETTPTVETAEAPSETKPEPNPNHEAAKYRKQLREVEAERDTLKQSLVQYQQDTINHAISGPIQLSFTPEEQRAGMTGSTNVLGEFVDGKPRLKNQDIQVSLRHPEDLFNIGGVETSALLDDNGQLDPTKLSDALKTLYAERRELFQHGPQPTPSLGTTPNTSDILKQRRESWQDMLKEAANKHATQ